MRTWVALSSLVLVVALAGCTPTGTPTPSPTATTSTPTPSSTPTSTPTATSAPTATVEPAPAAANCENLLDAATLATFTAHGATVYPTADYSDKIRNDPDPTHYATLRVFVDHVMCPVNVPPSFHVLELYGYAPTTPESEAATVAALVAEGWTETSSAGGRLFLHPAGGESEDIAFRYFFRNGYAWVAYDDTRLNEIIANSPAS